MDADVTKQYPSILDSFDKNESVKSLSERTVRFYLQTRA
jgi:hypothetical protein